MKFLAIENSNGEIAIVREDENQLDPVIEHEPVQMTELEAQLKGLSNEELVEIFNVKNPLLVASIADTIKVHREHLCLNKYGELFIIASCVFD